MSIDSLLGGVQNARNLVDQGIAGVGRLGKDLGVPGASSAAFWHDSLRPASYRGVPFGVLGSEGQFGRRNAVHQYPYRDTVWVEDLGRAARKVNITGFLVENAAYGGGDVMAQRERLIAASEAAQETAELIHPTLGRLTVSLAGPLVVTEHWDRGRYFEVAFSFIESGKKTFPDAKKSTGNAVTAAAAEADAAAAADFATRATSALSQGAAVVQQAANTAATWAGKVQKLANDATNLYNMVGTLKGAFGRYFGGRSKGGLTGKTISAAGGATTVQGLISQGANARSGVASALSSLATAARRLGT